MDSSKDTETKIINKKILQKKIKKTACIDAIKFQPNFDRDDANTV